MKFKLLCILLVVPHFSAYCASRTNPSKDTTQGQQVVYVPVHVTDGPNPIEEDKKLDQKLFMHFVDILGNVGKIFVNPHDKVNVTSNAKQMIDGVIAVAHELTRRNTLTESQQDRLVRLLLRALVEKGIIPPVILVGSNLR